MFNATLMQRTVAITACVSRHTHIQDQICWISCSKVMRIYDKFYQKTFCSFSIDARPYLTESIRGAKPRYDPPPQQYSHGVFFYITQVRKEYQLMDARNKNIQRKNLFDLFITRKLRILHHCRVHATTLRMSITACISTVMRHVKGQFMR